MFRPIGAILVFFAIQTAFTAHLAPLVGPVTTVLTYASCFLTYAALLWALRRETPTTNLLIGIVAAAFAIRGVLIFAPPLLSDDIFRYVWEGRVTLAGFNPFVHAPASETLAALRDDLIWPGVNHPDVPTIYPPISQLVFASVALFGGGTTLMRLAFIGIELLGVLAVLKIVGPHPRRLFGLALYVLNPLVIMEVAWSGHLDVLAWVPLTVSLLLVSRGGGARTHMLAGVLVGLSIAAKLLGVILLPYLLLRPLAPNSTRVAAARNRLILLAAASLVVVGSYGPFMNAGGQLFDGFGKYAASWRSNDGVFRAWETTSWISLQQGRPSERVFEFTDFNDIAIEHGFTKEWEGQTLPNTSFATNQISQTVSKALAAMVVGLALLWCILAVRDPIVAAIVVFGTLYLVAPTVHPWYVAWLVPLAALRPNATSVVFSGATVAAYVAWMSFHTGGAWLIPWWVVSVEYGLVLAVLVWEIGRTRQE